MSADNKAAAAWDDYINQQQQEKIEELERQLAAAKEQIKRLVEAGDAMSWTLNPENWLLANWREAKEVKP